MLRRKEKAIKKKRRKGDALRGLFEKSPLKIPEKLFGNYSRNVRRVHPKQRTSLFAPAAGGIRKAALIGVY